MNDVRSVGCPDIQINQLFGLGRIRDNVRTAYVCRKTYNVAGIKMNIPLFRFNRCLAADDIKDFFVLFVVMVTIGMFSGLNLHEVGRALGNVFDNRLNAEPVIALGLHLCGNFTVIFYNYFFHLFSPKMIAFKNNNFIMTFRLKCKVGTILL